ncbi:pimeloyl-ACP methyl ester carboxylesterase [Neolewinella xylanilytica]|uniref:Pimeloyl-ACP methyl ester carboxylesterase n=1 Tax=Neolewinella xylanilytica TaxID=1514080 RepID=A0A2S6IAB8_9BACT|nr:alpha/beta fold hydrolase [Neolewinella xylanilytica]PPK88447.1 pimeloyl-ACP methyl ester carboxylesterase [Neolewinella xylanilytica]
MPDRSTADVIDAHRGAGRFIQVDRLDTFVLDKGEGEAVVCLHGVPTSSFLYRKVVEELAALGLRGIAFDLPGLGLTDRPEAYDYSFTGLARFASLATEALVLDSYHLVVHDIGGPIGFAMAADQRERVRSITVLNSFIDVVNFKKPLPMRPFQVPVMGEAELALMNHLTWPLMFKGMCVADTDRVPREEMNAYVDLLKHHDKGFAFLKIMRNFTQTEAFRDRCYQAVQDVPYPVQAIWGDRDPGLTYEHFGEEIKRVAGLKDIFRLPAKHFLQEDRAPEIARRIAAIAQ